jgi:hypothetical protein
MGRSKDVACSYNAVAVTPSDSTMLPGDPRALYVGSTGNITALMAGGGAAVLFSNVPVGIFPIQVQRVNSTGTTAANIVALY